MVCVSQFFSFVGLLSAMLTTLFLSCFYPHRAVVAWSRDAKKPSSGRADGEPAKADAANDAYG